MKYLFLTLLFTICFCQSTYANDIEYKRKIGEKLLNFTIQDVYELQKTKSTNLKEYFDIINESFIKNGTYSIIKDRDLSTDTKYCFYNLKFKDIHNKLLDEYQKGYWSYNTKFFTAEIVLIFEQCMPYEKNSRQEIYDLMNDLFKELIMYMNVPVLQTKGEYSADYYLY